MIGVPLRGAFTGLLALLVTACSSGNMADLHKYVQEIKSRPGRHVEPLPEIKTFDTFVYVPEDRRDPFVRSVKSREETAVAEGDGIKPDTTRPPEELEQFPLDTLRMVGTLAQTETMWGVIKSNDGTIYRVQTGNHMGKNYGQITQITETEIKLTEIVPNRRGGWQERQASVRLSE